MNETEHISIDSLKYQLKQWNRLCKYLPPTDCDRDNVGEIEKIIESYNNLIKELNSYEYLNDEMTIIQILKALGFGYKCKNYNIRCLNMGSDEGRECNAPFECKDKLLIIPTISNKK